jgi:hypothetical protein
MDTRDFDDFTCYGEIPQGKEPRGFQEDTTLPSHAQSSIPLHHSNEEIRKIVPWLKHNGPKHPISFAPHFHFGHCPVPPPPHPIKKEAVSPGPDPPNP